MNFRSDQERYFACFLDELIKEGFVISYEYEPKAISLCSRSNISVFQTKKRKVTEKILKLNEDLIYTPDFKVKWNSHKSDKILTYTDKSTVCNKVPFFYRDSNDESYIEVKPPFDMNNMTRAVKTKLAWIYDKYFIYINLVIPEKLFKKHFFPDCFFTTDNGKPRRKKINGSYEIMSGLPGYDNINNFIQNAFDDLCD